MKKRIKSIVTTLLVALLSTFVTFCSPVTKQLTDFDPHIGPIDVCSDPEDDSSFPNPNITIED